MTMTKANKRAWVKALRSGEYKQCESVLCSVDEYGNESFCCLGVAFDVLVDGEWAPRNGCFADQSGRITGWDAVKGGESRGGVPPVEALEEMGITTDQARKAYQWNDDDGLTFDQISDKIAAGELDGVPL